MAVQKNSYFKNSQSNKILERIKRELIRITSILEPMVKIYDECLCIDSYSAELQAGEPSRN